MKRLPLALTTSAALLCTGCSCQTAETVLAGKSYVYEKGGFAGIGEFGIRLDADGTFSYYEGWASSYVGYGSWTIENGVLILSTDDGNYVNRFMVEGGDLVFLEDDSTNFLYVKVADGEKFLRDNN